MRILLQLCVCSLLAASALARPPASPPFMRMDDLGPKLTDLQSKLRRAEEFAKKSSQERMILMFEQKAERFAGKKLTDKGFVEEILVKWADVQKQEQECDADHLRVLGLLRGALRERYGAMPIPKAARYQASKVLVKALKSKHDIIRKTAISCLDGIYGRTLLYRYDASPGQRNVRYRKWLTEIDKLRK